MSAAEDDRRALIAAQERLGLHVELRRAAGPLAGAPFRAVARARDATPGMIAGYGAGDSAERAALLAVMEYVERQAQVGAPELPTATVAPYAALGDEALCPAAFGLYAEPQYADPTFECERFHAEAPREWVPAFDLHDGTRRLIPIELVFPRARLLRRPLVMEPSSGSAAPRTRAAAELTALCEVVERDGVMLFWYRAPPTATLDLASVTTPSLLAPLERARARGFVVTICRLTYDLGVPCFLVLALRGEALGYGLGCHPDGGRALSHALDELGGALDWLCEEDSVSFQYRAISQVRATGDHYALYHRGPLHGLLRQRLAATLQQGAPIAVGEAASDDSARAQLLAALAVRGYRAYGVDITPRAFAELGFSVSRVLAPGLIPIHFGIHRARFGCTRLTGTGAPGRLTTLLPHFLH